MKSDVDHKAVHGEPAKVFNYTLLARSEWLLLLSANFPVTLLTPLLLLASPYPMLFFVAMAYSFLQFLGIGVMLIVLAVVIDFLRGIASVNSQPIPQAVVQKLSDSLKGKIPEKLELLLKGSEIFTADLSMGAQVRGVIKPKLVLSGGIVVALARKEPKAIGILLHEYAHIQNLDSLLPAIIGLSIVELLGSLFSISHPGISMVTIFIVLAYKFVVFSMTIFYVSRTREYYADAYAVQQIEEKWAYREMLAGALEGKPGGRWSFFHPPLSRRIEACDNGHKVLFAGLFWKVYWLLAIFTSWPLVTLEYQVDEARMYYSGVIVVAVFGLAFELLRKRLLGLRSNSMIYVFLRWIMPGKRFFRAAFLIIGFITVSVLSQQYGEENAELLRALGGAVVFTVWLSLK